ncbi:hypothetical protein L1887_33758 [Cichorium endivia]|nr:hypothetical protein L1887_33758 [Cichorium endivia]
MEDRQERVNSLAGKKVESYMFFNYPKQINVEKLWSLFRRFGNVVDIYMTRKKLRNGQEFGFVRYANVMNPKRLEAELNGMWIGLYKLRIFQAWSKNGQKKMRDGDDMENQRLKHGHGRKDNKWDGRTYREVVKGEKKQSKISDGLKRKTPKEEGIEWLEIEIDKCPEIEEKLSKSIIGAVKKGEMLENMDQILIDGALVNCKWRFLGGLDVLIECGTAEEVEEIITNNEHGIKEWMKEFRLWTKEYVIRSRLTWIKLYGVPADAWSEKNFKKIASMWGTVVKLENCDFYAASTLVAGRVLISTPYEFPLEKEVVIKLEDRKVWVMVKDEGWVDEVGDDGAIDDEESNYSSSTEEEEDQWDEEISDINSVKSFPAEDTWNSGDDREGKQENSPQRTGSACMDVPTTKVWPSSAPENNNYDVGYTSSLSGGSNGLNAKVIYNGTRVDDVDRNKRSVEKEIHHVELGHKKGYGMERGMDQGNKVKAQNMEKNENSPKCRLEEKIETQLADNLNNEELDPYEDQWSDSQRMEFAYDELKEKKKHRNFSKVGKKSRSEGHEREASRSARKWDGSRSMRMFNKLVRDRYKRRSMVNDREVAPEKIMTCPKTKMVNHMSKSRDSTEDIQDQIEGIADDIQSLKKFGTQIGFDWENDDEVKKEVQLGEARGQGQ